MPGNAARRPCKKRLPHKAARASRPQQTCPRDDRSPVGSSRHRVTGIRRMRQAYLAATCVFAASTAAAQHRHPPQDQALHEKFYSTWYMPDNPARSCCNDADCYPTEIKYVGGNIYARRREDGKYILIPAQKVERDRDNPDGRNHLSAQAPNSFQPADAVFCFSLGGGT